MRFWTFLVLLFVGVTTVLAWEKEDHEIFDLVSEVEAAEGKGTTFYSWLGVPSTASTTEIAKAYRKMSIKLHPDKNPRVKDVHKRFARLGVVSTILRNKESRKRYDFFYKNGVPKWRGTGYYYSRFRPGLGTVLVFLVMLTSGLQYLVQGIKYKGDLERIETIVSNARTAAWGAKMIPTTGQKKVRVNLGGSSRLDEDGNVVQGRMIDMVVEGLNVYILEPNGDLELVDSSAATPPSIKGTWFVQLVRTLVGKLREGKEGKENGDSKESEEDDETESESASGYSTPESTGKRSAGPRPATMAAGGRRKGKRSKRN